MKNIKLLSIVAGLTVAGAFATAQAGDDLLNVLVSKGYITSSEAKNISGSKGMFTAKGKHTRSIRFNGRVQAQWDTLDTELGGVADPEETSHFYVRRLRFGAKAKLAEGWYAETVYDFAGNELSIDKALIGWKATDYAKFKFGYTKVPFGIEETTSSSKIKTVERSAINRFFADDIDFGARHMGIFLSGDLGDSGIMYSGSLTNALQGEGSKLGGSQNASNDYMYVGRLQYEFDLDGGDLLIGGDYGHQTKSNKVSDAVTGEAADVSAYNLYGRLDYEGLQVTASYMAGSLEDAKAGGSDLDVTGWALEGAYKLTDDFEPVIRYSAVDTDGGHIIETEELIRRSPTAVSSTTSIDDDGTWDELTSWYLGFNYYILGNDLKLTAGYEWAEAEESNNAAVGDAEVTGFRARLQLLF